MAAMSLDELADIESVIGADRVSDELVLLDGFSWGPPLWFRLRYVIHGWYTCDPWPRMVLRLFQKISR